MFKFNYNVIIHKKKVNSMNTQSHVKRPMLSVIIPAYNDSATIGNTIETMADFFTAEGLRAEMIIVSDGGKDQSAQCVQEKIKKYPWIKLIDRKFNMGKGYTVREGLKNATGDFVFYTDADLPYLTHPIKQMLDILQTRTADLVLANRELSHKDNDEKPPLPRRITHWVYSRFVRSLIPFEFNDTLAGLKGMRKEVSETIVPKLTIDRFSFDVELLLATKLAGFQIKEIPVSLKNVGKSNLSILRDTPQMAKEIIQIFIQYKKGLYDK